MHPELQLLWQARRFSELVGSSLVVFGGALGCICGVGVVVEWGGAVHWFTVYLLAGGGGALSTPNPLIFVY